ncbi:8d6a2e08-f1e5-4155-94da-1fc3be39d1ff-CDS [Sclerotinia trifoliorum]|uniref:8d6a2e08-f1e5-4155-94da-1fc3be39d1ff-CDS n=1 Tax=Sclerotinia trifoliorum TaxID=28548 RepID=A0A8H2VQ91_9HELO|nr:8d6a2e08-f1e5-4155-94da-1fc3be39d1ff-CDS [Sclerotinia trifoliorum]
MSKRRLMRLSYMMTTTARSIINVKGAGPAPINKEISFDRGVLSLITLLMRKPGISESTQSTGHGLLLSGITYSREEREATSLSNGSGYPGKQFLEKMEAWKPISGLELPTASNESTIPNLGDSVRLILGVHLHQGRLILIYSVWRQD